jgi:hypothetical protein
VRAGIRRGCGWSSREAKVRVDSCGNGGAKAEGGLIGVESLVAIKALDLSETKRDDAKGY